MAKVNKKKQWKNNFSTVFSHFIDYSELFSVVTVLPDLFEKLLSLSLF